jgi:BirA family biotin operon repressor/biotin-[acetyl-CoA-carboxylase] ligase
VQLSPPGDPWPPALADALRTRPAPGWDASPVVFFEQTGSTNDVAAALAAEGAVDGTAVIARAQTAGRGRRGRPWASPPGAGLYFSVLVRPPAAVVRPPGAPAPVMLLTLVTAVAIADAIAAVSGFTPAIKWPNDLVTGLDRGATPGDPQRRKLAGILAEGAVSGDAIQHVVIGVGINLTPAAYPPDVAAIATSIRAEAGRDVDGFELLAACRASLARDLATLFAGESSTLLERWRRGSPSSEGARVRWEQEGRLIEGVTAGLADNGALRIRTPDGLSLSIVSGEIEWL